MNPKHDNKCVLFLDVLDGKDYLLLVTGLIDLMLVDL